jgi:hypothetical protein
LESSKAYLKRDPVLPRLPDFIAVGPPRTGTTWLERALRGHIGLPTGIKETQFFRWNYGMGLDWYQSFFRDCPAELPVGEIAPTYFDADEARERIAATIPECRIICSLRDPVARIYSQYKAWNRVGLIQGPFDYASQRTALSASHSYAYNLRAWRKLFGDENVLAVLYDDLRTMPQAYLDSVCDFVGISRIDLATSPVGAAPVNLSERGPRHPVMARWAHALRVQLVRRRKFRLAHLIEADKPIWRFFFSSGSSYPPLENEREASLRREFRPEIEELEALLGRDLSAWKN